MARTKSDKTTTTTRKRGRPKGSGPGKGPKASGPKEAHLVVKGKRGGLVSLNIRNGGAAAKIFLVKADGTLDRVVPADEYAAVLRDEKVAHSKRGLSKGTGAYLARGAVIKADQKDAVVKEVSKNFKALKKMVESGELKAATGRVKAEVIMLE
jgi:hypothetical protein